MKICVAGVGYVGLVTAACFAERGHEVICADSDAAKIDRLRRGELPISEPGLDEIVARNAAAGRLTFTVGVPPSASGASVFFIAVGTPPSADGSADLAQVFAAFRDIEAVASDGALVVVKSTVPPGTGGRLRVKAAEAAAARGGAAREILSNPEFLREGCAVRDCLSPDRVVIGTSSPGAEHVMRELYRDFAPPEQIFVMSPESAEIAKYAANTMLAARISLMNEIAGLCDEVGADVEAVRVSLAADHRIGPHFLSAGCGYGGSCFPKDVRALVRSGELRGLDMPLASAVEKVNIRQKERLAILIRERFGDLRGVKAAVLGLAFKPGTDDMREAPSVNLITTLLGMGAEVTACDPAAAETARRVLPPDAVIAASPEEALAGADCAALVTEWPEFAAIDWHKAGATMRGRVIFDGRNFLSPEAMRSAGFEYYCVGRGMTPEHRSSVLK